MQSYLLLPLIPAGSNKARKKATKKR